MNQQLGLEIPCKSKHLYYVRNQDRIFTYNRYSKTSCTLGINEWTVLNLCNGERNIDDLYSVVKELYSQQELEVLIKLLAQNNLLTQYEVKYKKHILRTKLGITCPLKQDVKFRLLYNIYFYFFTILFIPTLLYGLSVSNFSMLFSDIKASLNLKGILCYYIISSLTLILHECAHAFTAKRYGGYIVEVGFMFYLFAPFFYVTIGGLSFVKNKKQRMMITLSGIIVNLFLVGVALIGYSTNHTGLRNTVWLPLLITNMGQIILNLNCFIKVDLYFCLTQMLEEDNLYSRSMKACKTLLKEHRLKKENNTLYIYGIVAILNLVIIPFMLLSLLLSINDIVQYFV